MLEKYCKTEDNDVVIRIPIDAFIHGILNSEYAYRVYEWNGNYLKTEWNVVDPLLFVEDVLCSLTQESEDGSSILSGAFDHAFESLMEYGFSNGIESTEVVS